MIESKELLALAERREAIARIIDPWAWSGFDHYAKSGCTPAAHNSITKPSLEKADAILSLHPGNNVQTSGGSFSAGAEAMREACVKVASDVYDEASKTIGYGPARAKDAARKIGAALSALPLPSETQVQTRFSESESTTHRESVTKSGMIERVAHAINRSYEQFADPTPGQMARAAIEAMRDPTEAMTDAAWNNDEVGLFGAKSVWQTMIDAELSTDASACPTVGFLPSSLNQSTSPTPPSAGDGEPVAWIVDRKSDPTFPRLYLYENAAHAMAGHVTVNPPAIVRALYTHPQPAPEVREALKFYADPFQYQIDKGLKPTSDGWIAVPDFYDELDFGATADAALASQTPGE